MLKLECKEEKNIPFSSLALFLKKRIHHYLQTLLQANKERHPKLLELAHIPECSLQESLEFFIEALNWPLRSTHAYLEERHELLLAMIPVRTYINDITARFAELCIIVYSFLTKGIKSCPRTVAQQALNELYYLYFSHSQEIYSPHNAMTRSKEGVMRLPKINGVSESLLYLYFFYRLQNIPYWASPNSVPDELYYSYIIESKRGLESIEKFINNNCIYKKYYEQNKNKEKIFENAKEKTFRPEQKTGDVFLSFLYRLLNSQKKGLFYEHFIFPRQNLSFTSQKILRLISARKVASFLFNEIDILSPIIGLALEKKPFPSFFLKNRLSKLLEHINQTNKDKKISRKKIGNQSKKIIYYSTLLRRNMRGI